VYSACRIWLFQWSLCVMKREPPERLYAMRPRTSHARYIWGGAQTAQTGQWRAASHPAHPAGPRCGGMRMGLAVHCPLHALAGHKAGPFYTLQGRRGSRGPVEGQVRHKFSTSRSDACAP